MKLKRNETHASEIKKTSDTNLEIQTINVEKLKKGIANLELNIKEYTNKYEIDLSTYKNHFETSINQCNTDFKTEKEKNHKITIDFRELKNVFDRTENNVKAITQKYENLENQSKVYIDQNNVFKIDIDKLRQTIINTNTELKTCVGNIDDVRKTYTSCRSDVSACNDKLNDARNTISKNELTINNNTNEINIIKGRANQCEANYSGLSCESSRTVTAFQDALNKIGEALNNVPGIINNSQSHVVNFVKSNDVKCTRI